MAVCTFLFYIHICSLDDNLILICNHLLTTLKHFIGNISIRINSIL